MEACGWIEGIGGAKSGSMSKNEPSEGVLLLPILKASLIPAALFQLFCVIGFPSSDVILLQMSFCYMIQVECNSFNVVKVNFTSMSSSLLPASKCNLISLEYHSVNFRLKNYFGDLYTVRSKG